MPNIFDQFDTPSVAPDGPNPFDAFDGNIFDQFDEPVPPKFANLPGSIKLNPLQQVQMQSLSADKGIDPENAGATLANLLRGTDDIFLQSVAPPIVAAAHTVTDNPLTRKIGFGLNFAGQAIKGDVESALFSLLGQNELANQQLIATAAKMNPAWNGEMEQRGIDTSDPYEDARETLPVAEHMASGIGPGLLQSAPQLVLAALQPELGAASFGFTPQGFDPVQAAAMMVAPAVGKFVGGIAGDLAAKAGISDAQALDVINHLGGGTGVASIISAPAAYQIAQMKPGPERDEAIQDAASNAILTGILGGIGAQSRSAEPPGVETTLPAENIAHDSLPNGISAGQPTGKPISQKLDDLAASLKDIKIALRANQILPNDAEPPTDITFADQTTGNTGKVRIQSPGGDFLYIPQERLQAALNAGYRIPPTPIPQRIDDLTATVRSLQTAIKGNQLTPSPRFSDPVPVETTAYQTPSEETRQSPPDLAATVDRGMNGQVSEGPSFSEPAERLAQNLESLKTGIGNGGQLHAFGIAADLWDRAVTVAQHFIRGGGSAADAIEQAIGYIKRNFKAAFDERGARAALVRSLVLPENAPQDSKGLAKVASAPGQSAKTAPSREWSKYDLRKIPVGSDPIALWQSFPKSETSVTPQQLPKTQDGLRLWARNQLAKMPEIVRSPWGKEVALYRLNDVTVRASHYISDSTSPFPSRERAETLPMLSHTIRNAMAHATVQGRRWSAYLYRYAGGQLHVAIINNDKGIVEGQFVATQHPNNPNLRTSSDLRVLYRNGIEGKPWGILSGEQRPTRWQPLPSSVGSASKHEFQQGEDTKQQPKKAKIQGGAYKNIEADGGAGHHMPAKSVSPPAEGPAIWMEAADHRRTRSWGNSIKAQKYRAAQAKLINEGKFREAIQMDINDIRSKFGRKYDPHIQQMLDYYNTIPAWKLKPPGVKMRRNLYG